MGEILQEEFLQPLAMTPYRLAKELRVATSSILDIVHGRRRLSVDVALRLARLFGTTERFWLNLKNDIDVRNRRDELSGGLEAMPLRSPAGRNHLPEDGPGAGESDEGRVNPVM